MRSDDADLFDLHVHSIRSDGVHSLLQLIQLARRSGLAGFAVTDHDVLPEPTALSRANEVSGLTVLAGVELSVLHEDRVFHLLGYGFDASHAKLRTLCETLQKQRKERLAAIVDKLSRQGVRIKPSVQRQWDNCPSPGRMHVARELVRSRVVQGIRGAFQRYLQNQPFAVHVPIEEAIEALHSAGGIAVLAHPPARLSCETWQGLIATGLDGLETRHPSLSTSHQRFLDERVQEYELVATAGSDYHGDETRRYMGMHTLTREELQQTLSVGTTLSK